MKKIILGITIVIILIIIGALAYKSFGGRTTSYINPAKTENNAATTPMTITSPVFEPGQAIPKKYSCDGDGVNPPLDIKDVPQQAQSLALIVDDPDAPAGTWTHWIMWNINPATASIAENSVPAGAVQGQGSSGQNVFGAPCPPSGTHRYYFKLFALDSKLSLSSFSDVKALEQAMDGHIISNAEVLGTYSR